MKNGKLVLLCGAGFPIMWGSPKSAFLTKTIKNIVQEELRDNISLSSKLINNDSFETILAAIESLLYYHIDKFNFGYLASFFNNSSLKIQYIAKQPCAASTRDL